MQNRKNIYKSPLHCNTMKNEVEICSYSCMLHNTKSLKGVCFNIPTCYIK